MRGEFDSCCVNHKALVVLIRNVQCVKVISSVGTRVKDRDIRLLDAVLCGLQSQ